MGRTLGNRNFLLRGLTKRTCWERVKSHLNTPLLGFFYKQENKISNLRAENRKDPPIFTIFWRSPFSLPIFLLPFLYHCLFFFGLIVLTPQFSCCPFHTVTDAFVVWLMCVSRHFAIISPLSCMPWVSSKQQWAVTYIIVLILFLIVLMFVFTTRHQ